MKKIGLLLLLAILFFPVFLSAQADAISRYFQNYMNDTAFTSVYISPKMFSLIAKMKVDDMDPEVQEMMQKLQGLRILTTDSNARKYYKEALNRMNINGYESLMTVNSNDEDVQFLIKSTGNTINELLLLVGGDEFVMLSMIGEIDLDKISKMASSLDVKGSEHLEKIKSEK